MKINDLLTFLLRNCENIWNIIQGRRGSKFCFIHGWLCFSHNLCNYAIMSNIYATLHNYGTLCNYATLWNYATKPDGYLSYHTKLIFCDFRTVIYLPIKWFYVFSKPDVRLFDFVEINSLHEQLSDRVR